MNLLKMQATSGGEGGESNKDSHIIASA